MPSLIDLAHSVESNNLYGRPFEFDPKSQGPHKRRNCTDTCCFLLFFIAVSCWIAIGVFGVIYGDPERIFHPINSFGRQCGRGRNSNRKYLFHFDFTRCLNSKVITYGCPSRQICVKQCPLYSYSVFNDLETMTDIGVKTHFKKFCAPMSNKQWETLSAPSLTEQEFCPSWTVPSYHFFKVCLPRFNDSSIDKLKSQIVVSSSIEQIQINGDDLIKSVSSFGSYISSKFFVERFFNDLYAVWTLVLGAFLFTGVISFLWIIMLRFLAKVLIWASLIWLVVLIATVLTLNAIKVKWSYQNQANSATIFKIVYTQDYLQRIFSLTWIWIFVMSILCILLLLVIVVAYTLRKKLKLAIKFIEIIGKAVHQMFLTSIYPVLPIAFQIGIIFWFGLIIVTWCSMSLPSFKVLSTEFNMKSSIPSCKCENPDTNIGFQPGDKCNPKAFDLKCKRLCPELLCQFTEFQISIQLLMVYCYNIFLLYWCTNFCMGHSQMVLSGVFSKWYWTWDKESAPNTQLFLSLYQVNIFHCGTLAFGSLFITPLRLPRLLIRFMVGSARNSSLVIRRIFEFLCRCCFECFEVFLKYITRNAYIVCAVRSTNLLTSGNEAYNLIIRNEGRATISNTTVDFALFSVKLAIVSFVTFSSFWILRIWYDYHGLMPLVFISVGSYLICSYFFGIYSTAMDTIFLCFLEDLERNNGSKAKPYYMPIKLRKVMRKMTKINKKSRTQLSELQEIRNSNVHNDNDETKTKENRNSP
ncbi:choline transporter-like protein 2 [Lepeophtheirus salmonis]|nr:choline transporter-like 2 [Lepeophtheirus salmonis]